MLVCSSSSSSSSSIGFLFLCACWLFLCVWCVGEIWFFLWVGSGCFVYIMRGFIYGVVYMFIGEMFVMTCL